MIWKGFEIKEALAPTTLESNEWVVAQKNWEGKVTMLWWIDPLKKDTLYEFYRVYANRLIPLSYEIKRKKNQVWLYITIYNKYTQTWEVRLA